MPIQGRERPPFSRLFARQSAVRRYGVAPGHDGEIAGRPLRDPSSPSSKCNSTTWMPLLAAILHLGHAARGRHDWGKLRLNQPSRRAPQANLRSDSDRNWPLIPPETISSGSGLFLNFGADQVREGWSTRTGCLSRREVLGIRSRTFSANCTGLQRRINAGRGAETVAYRQSTAQGKGQTQAFMVWIPEGFILAADAKHTKRSQGATPTCPSQSQ
jgi:hypothetical protein